MANDEPTVIARYAPGRIVFAALRRIVPSAAFLVFSAHLWETGFWNDGPGSDFYLGAFLFALFVFAPCLGLIAGLRMLTRTRAGGFFKADRTGISLKFPMTSRFSTRLETIEIPWSNIQKIYPYEFIVNMITVSNELRIELRSGGRIAVNSYYFDRSPKQMQVALQRIIES